MKRRHDPNLLDVLADLESAIAAAAALQSKSLDLIRSAAETVISELYDDQSKTKVRSRTSASKKLKRVA